MHYNHMCAYMYNRHMCVYINSVKDKRVIWTIDHLVIHDPLQIKMMHYNFIENSL